jgi:hypothetical protein
MKSRWRHLAVLNEADCDLPAEGVFASVPGREDAMKWYGWLVGNFLLVVDIMVAVPTLWLFARYARLSPMAEGDWRQRLAELQE